MHVFARLPASQPCCCIVPSNLAALLLPLLGIAPQCLCIAETTGAKYCCTTCATAEHRQFSPAGRAYEATIFVGEQFGEPNSFPDRESAGLCYALLKDLLQKID